MSIENEVECDAIPTYQAGARNACPITLGIKCFECGRNHRLCVKDGERFVF